MKSIEQSIAIIKTGLAYRAKRHYLEGEYGNPFMPPHEEFGTNFNILDGDIKQGMAELYHREMQKLIKERAI